MRERFSGYIRPMIVDNGSAKSVFCGVFSPGCLRASILATLGITLRKFTTTERLKRAQKEW